MLILQKRTKQILSFVLFFKFSVALAADPAWWSDFSSTAILSSVPHNIDNWAPINLGQLKNVATQAKKYLDACLINGGEAGQAINTACQFSESDNYAPANVGQLKNIAKVFYDRLNQIGYNWQTKTYGVPTTIYPWGSASGLENYAPVNIGQLKNIFDFELSDSFLSQDHDNDGIPSWWEKNFGLNPTINNSLIDSDLDGLSDVAEYQNNSNPLIASSNGPSSPNDYIRSLNNNSIDSDGDTLVNGEDAVPWNKNLHFKRTPETGYVATYLGAGAAFGVNDRGEVIIHKTVGVTGNYANYIYVWKNGILRELIFPPLRQGASLEQALGLTVKDFDNFGRLLVERKYSGDWTTDLVIFQDVSQNVPGELINVNSARPTASVTWGSPISSIAFNYSISPPALLSNGSISQINVDWMSYPDAWKTCALTFKRINNQYVAQNGIGFPWATDYKWDSQASRIEEFLAGTRDRWGFMSAFSPLTWLETPVFTKPQLAPLQGVDVFTNTGFNFASFQPTMMAPLKISECLSNPIVIETDSINSSQGTSGWVYEDVPVGNNTNNWQKFQFRSKPDTSNPNGAIQRLISSRWNSRGECVAYDNTGSILWRNGIITSIKSLFGLDYLPNPVQFPYSPSVNAGINTDGVIPVTFSRHKRADGSSDVSPLEGAVYLLIPFQLEVLKPHLPSAQWASAQWESPDSAWISSNFVESFKPLILDNPQADNLNFKIKLPLPLASKVKSESNLIIQCAIHPEINAAENSFESTNIIASSNISNDGKDLWCTVSNTALKTIRPAESSDVSVMEIFSYDVSSAGGNFTDSDAFDRAWANLAQKTHRLSPRVLVDPLLPSASVNGNWTNESINTTVGSIPAWTSGMNSQLFNYGGADYLSIRANNITAKCSVKNQADMLYFSGHGYSIDASLITNVLRTYPEDVHWAEDLEMVIISGCAILDVNDYNGNYDDDNLDGDNDRSTGTEIGGPSNKVWPGQRWAKTGPKILLGYNYSAPRDGAGKNPSPANLIDEFVGALPSVSSSASVCNLWMNLNLNRAKNIYWDYTNACAIFVENGNYYYMYYQKKGYLSGIRTVSFTVP